MSGVSPTVMGVMIHPAPLLSAHDVSTQWLADYLGADRLVVLDASERPNGAPGDLIPGAAHLDPATSLGASTESAGIDSESAVVVYDDGDGLRAARLLERLRDIGIDRVAVLEGGIAAWRAEGRTVQHDAA